MNIKPIHFILSAGISLLLITACQSKTENAETAFEQVKDEKDFYGENTSQATTSHAPRENKKVMKPVMPASEWSQFSTGMNQVIELNEAHIKAIRKMKSPDDKTSKRLLQLEESNNTLKREMILYEEEEKQRLEKFRLRLSSDAEEIRTEIVLLKNDADAENTRKTP